MNRRKDVRTLKTPSALRTVVERLESQAMLAGLGQDSLRGLGSTTAVLLPGVSSTPGIVLSGSSPAFGSQSGTGGSPSTAPVLLSGSGSGTVASTSGASGSSGLNGPVLLISTGSGTGSSRSGAESSSKPNGPVLSSQYTGGADAGGQGTAANTGNGGDLWLLCGAGSGTGSSSSGATGGSIATSQSPGTGGTLTNADLWSLYGAGAGANSSAGSSNVFLANDPTLSAKYTGGSGGGQRVPAATFIPGGLVCFVTGATGADVARTGSQQGTTGSTALALADGQSSATTTPLVYQPGSDDGPGFVSGVWTGDDGGWQIVRVADAATAGESASDSRGWISAIGDVAVGVGSYVGRSTKSLVFGDWTDEAPTALSIGAGFGLGIVGADLPLDISNLGHTVSHPEMSYDWGKRLVINGVAVLPVIGVIKYLKYFDDAGDLAKRADDISAGRRLAGQGDAGNYPTPPGRSADWTWAPGSSEGRTGWRWWDPQGDEWRWHPSDSWHPNGHWDHNPWQTWNDRWRNVDVPSGGNPAASP